MYKVLRTEIVESPEIEHDDVMSMSDASRTLGLSLPGVDTLMRNGTLTTVIDETGRTAYNNPRRLVLRREVERLARERAEERRRKHAQTAA